MPTRAVKPISGYVLPTNTAAKCIFAYRLHGSNFAKIFQVVSLVILHLGFSFLVVSYQTEAQAQTLQARITARTLAPAKLQIDLEFPVETDVLSFRNSYGGVFGLAQRIGTLGARSASGEPVTVKKLAPGEFKSAVKVARFSYEVDVTEPSRPENMSHISWLNRQHGLLMPADLLPRPINGTGNFSEVRLSLDIPAGWTISSNIDPVGKQEFFVAEPDKTVFLIGPDLHQENKQLGSGRFRLTTSGQWPFSEAEAMKTARKIIEEYARVTGFKLNGHSSLMLLPFPENAGPERWSAEARGNAVVLLLGRRGNRQPLLARLAILLSHELFHLWVPNSLKLDGNYDWFFEGFTIYQALLTDVRLGLISFDEYVETIGRVYQSYLHLPDRDKLSLIEASERRWTTSPSLVYDKGMLVAFIYDLMLRSSAGCKASLSDVYKGLFRTHSTGQGNANETIIRLLSERGGTETFVKDYVEGHRSFDFESLVSPYGFEIQSRDSRPRLTVGGHLNKAQRRLLGCLGHKS
ncbi:MAG: hypothetical protein AABN95_11560 [Acidobacteriota bacterium]